MWRNEEKNNPGADVCANHSFCVLRSILCTSLKREGSKMFHVIVEGLMKSLRHSAYFQSKIRQVLSVSLNRS